MSTPTEPSASENTYFIDAENAAEMARLTVQDRLITKGIGGLIPEHSDLSNIHDILDIACGPGAWALDVAHEYPKTQVVGVDKSKLMIQYAQAQAQEQKLPNASFREMDVLKPLDFPDSSFDLINARLLLGFMSPAIWPKFLQECLRITRPGGFIRLVESDLPMSNSLALEQLFGMTAKALQVAGQSFSPNGQQICLVPMLGRLLHDAGYQNIEKKASVIDLSAGMEAHASTYQDFMVIFKLLQPFMIKGGVTTQEEVDVLYNRAMAEMMLDSFCGVWFFLCGWAEKPLQASK